MSNPMKLVSRWNRSLVSNLELCGQEIPIIFEKGRNKIHIHLPKDLDTGETHKITFRLENHKGCFETGGKIRRKSVLMLRIGGLPGDVCYQLRIKDL